MHIYIYIYIHEDKYKDVYFYTRIQVHNILVYTNTVLCKHTPETQTQIKNSNTDTDRHTVTQTHTPH